MNYNLLSCPFCGGEAEERVKGLGTGDPKHFIRCTKCGARTAETVCSPKYVQDWNRRDGRKCECFTCRYWERTAGGWDHFCVLVHQKRESCDFCSRWESGK